MSTILLQSASGDSYEAEIRNKYTNTSDVVKSFGGKMIQPGQSVYQIGLPGQEGSYTRSRQWVLARMVDVGQFKIEENPDLAELYADLGKQEATEELSEAEIPEPATA